MCNCPLQLLRVKNIHFDSNCIQSSKLQAIFLIDLRNYLIITEKKGFVFIAVFFNEILF